MANQFKLEAVIEAKNNASRVFKDLADDIKTSERRMQDVADRAGSVGRRMSLFVTTPLLGAGVAAIKAAADFEQAQIAFETMLGSAEQAKSLLEDLARFGARTPFELKEVEQGAKQLLAMGAGADDLIDELRMLGDISAGLSVPMERLILNFGQVRLQGKLTGRELRDFAVAGVPLIDELATTMGVAKEEVADLVSEGKIGFAEVEAAFESMTSEGGRFHNLMQNQSETTAGQFSNLKDEINLLARDMGKIELPVAKDLIQALREMVAIFESLSTSQQKFIISLGLFLAIAGPVLIVLSTLINSLLTLKGVIVALKGTEALGGLVALMSGPVVLALALAVALVIGVYLAWRKNWFGIRDLVKNTTNDIRKDIDTWTDTIRKEWNAFTATMTAIAENFAFYLKETLITAFFLILAVIDIVTDEGVMRFIKWAENLKRVAANMGRELEREVKIFMNEIAWDFEIILKGIKERWDRWSYDVSGTIQDTAQTSKSYIKTFLVELGDIIIRYVPSIIIPFSLPSLDRVLKVVKYFLEAVREEIDRIKPSIDLNVNIPSLESIQNRISGLRTALSTLLGFQTGGIVPGAPGQPRLAVVHGGERVLPVDKARVSGGGGGSTININVSGMVPVSAGARREIALMILEDLQRAANSQNVSLEELAKRV